MSSKVIFDQLIDDGDSVMTNSINYKEYGLAIIFRLNENKYELNFFEDYDNRKEIPKENFLLDKKSLEEFINNHKKPDITVERRAEILKASKLNLAFEGLENPEIDTKTKKYIEYLYDHETCLEIEEKVIHYLKNAFNYELLEDSIDLPLWYSIIAEKYLSEKIIDPLINIYLEKDEDFSCLYEQGALLLYRLSQKYPDIVTKKILKATKKQIKKKSESPYLYLFEALNNKNILNYKKELIEILEDENLYWDIPFIMALSDLDFKEIIPILKQKILKYSDENSIIHRNNRMEIEYCINDLEKGVKNDDNYYSKNNQKSWQERYSTLFIKQKIMKKKKIGRNEKCPCESGKKYKKCCGKNSNK